jgi:hypothetical protein
MGLLPPFFYRLSSSPSYWESQIGSLMMLRRRTDSCTISEIGYIVDSQGKNHLRSCRI